MSVWVLIIRDPGVCHVQTGPRTCKGSKIRTRIQEMPGPGQGYSVHWLYCSLQSQACEIFALRALTRSMTSLG